MTKKILVNLSALTLIALFSILFFSSTLTKLDTLYSFFICLLISFISFGLGVYSLVKKISNKISILIIVLSVLIFLFSIFAYLLPEAGYPALIKMSR